MTKNESQKHCFFMQEALKEAKQAELAGEVPVGAVLVANDEIVARGHNSSIKDSDPTAHAEIVALRAAGKKLGNYRLNGLTLYVTLEPCPMCATALLYARIEKIFFGASDEKFGACGSNLNFTNSFNHQITVEKGLMAEESSLMLKNFFKAKRRILKNEDR